MSINKADNKKIIKIVIVSLGVVFIGGGLGPYLIDHFSAETMSTDPLVEKQVSTQNDVLPILETTQPLLQQNNTALNKASIKAEKVEYIEPLPELQDSDQFVFENFNISDKQIFAPLDLIRNSVVFIDNFSKGELVGKFSPLKKPTTPFLIEKNQQSIIIAPESYQRYDIYAQTISQIDVDSFMTLYTRLTPLINQAYQDIGYPHGSFNSTINKAISEVLDTPIIRYDIKLKADSVTYKFADENLELLPDTQKLMLRMGPDNLQSIQNKLEQIQSELQEL